MSRGMSGQASSFVHSQLQRNIPRTCNGSVRPELHPLRGCRPSSSQCHSAVSTLEPLTTCNRLHERIRTRSSEWGGTAVHTLCISSREYLSPRRGLPINRQWPAVYMLSIPSNSPPHVLLAYMTSARRHATHIAAGVGMRLTATLFYLCWNTIHLPRWAILIGRC